MKLNNFFFFFFFFLRIQFKHASLMEQKKISYLNQERYLHHKKCHDQLQWNYPVLTSSVLSK